MAEMVYRKVQNNELYHFGTKGQKWGERRYQNEDGTLTEEGRIHYGYGKAKTNLLNAKTNYKNARKSNNQDNIDKAANDLEKAKRDYTYDQQQRWNKLSNNKASAGAKIGNILMNGLNAPQYRAARMNGDGMITAWLKGQGTTILSGVAGGLAGATLGTLTGNPEYAKTLGLGAAVIGSYLGTKHQLNKKGNNFEK